MNRAHKNTPAQRARSWIAETLQRAVIDIVAKGLVIGGVAVAGLVVALVVRGGRVPAWALVVIVALAIVAVGLIGRALRATRAQLMARTREVTQLGSEAARVTELSNELESLRWAIERHEVYGQHFQEMLSLLQRVLSGDVPGVSMAAFILHGVLLPARDMLPNWPGEDIRLSILVPRGDRFTMPWAAGHRVESQQKFSLPIKTSLSRFAFEEGVTHVWDNVAEDHTWQPHPEATRPFCSMVSMPIRVGSTVGAVFNVISTEEHAFDAADLTYIASLGPLIDVAVGLHLREANPPEGSSN